MATLRSKAGFPDRSSGLAAKPPSPGTLVPLVRRLLQICTAASAEFLAAQGLVLLEMGALANLSRQSGQPDIDQNGLAERLSIDRYSASLLVDRLEAKGIIERRVNGLDRRARLLRLTPRGEKLYARLRAPVDQIRMRILAPLEPKERELFLGYLARVVEANRALVRPGAGRRKPRRLESDSSRRPV
jgi:DNA-binding MarR family transcriptional regulator